MNNTITYMTANDCARAVGWNMTEGWGQGEKATREFFRPLPTYETRLDDYLNHIRAMGFNAIDLWLPVLDDAWATDEHIDIFNDVMQKTRLKVVGVAGWLGSSPEQFERICEIASEVGATVLGGGTTMLTKDRPFVVDTLQKYGLQLGIENHPEKSPQELRDKIGDGGEGTLGACVDTGWFGTQGYNAAQALEELADVLFHVHLKDVRETGKHDTCRFGQGVVPIQDCVDALRRIQYTGAVVIEHEPEFFDPTEDIKASYALLKEWMQ
ncbi:MAG: sugar phosphate isomerase/epimerase family protein [bacterium]|nr:sugar phosphate isomerase/epimerase family protein [bacterium]